jgi:hypothetical protein
VKIVSLPGKIEESSPKLNILDWFKDPKPNRLSTIEPRKLDPVAEDWKNPYQRQLVVSGGTNLFLFEQSTS